MYPYFTLSITIVTSIKFVLLVILQLGFKCKKIVVFFMVSDGIYHYN